MKIIEDKIQNIIVDERLSIALGTFDGVHRGHQKLINHAVSFASSNGLKSAVMTFNKHPFEILKPEYCIKIITDNKTKARIFESLGVDYVFFVEFDWDFADIDPIKFIEYLRTIFKAESVVCGYNYTFGKHGTGDTKLLYKYSGEYGYKLKVIDKVTYNNHSVSSTIIRKKIEAGKIEEANMLLGYDLFYSGNVIHGKNLGNTLGFPTANIKIPGSLCLKNGVYITKTHFNGKIYPSISNVGYSPTVENLGRSIETHILDFNEDLYGSDIKIDFQSYLREEKKFNSITELKERVLKDISIVRKYFA